MTDRSCSSPGATRLAKWWREASWIWRGIVGANAYEIYLSHHFGTGCEHEPLSEREFWRRKYAEEDRNPGARCC